MKRAHVNKVAGQVFLEITGGARGSLAGQEASVQAFYRKIARWHIERIQRPVEVAATRFRQLAAHPSAADQAHELTALAGRLRMLLGEERDESAADSTGRASDSERPSDS